MTTISTVTVASNNITWTQGFKTTEGNGFVRREPTFPYTGGPAVGHIPPANSYFALFGATANIEMDQSEADELIGSEVTSASGSFFINADYLTATGQFVIYPDYEDPPISIDKLTPF
jgi:hypothetical protein